MELVALPQCVQRRFKARTLADGRDMFLEKLLDTGRLQFADLCGKARLMFER
jgi:hypothetical protein